MTASSYPSRPALGAPPPSRTQAGSTSMKFPALARDVLLSTNCLVLLCRILRVRCGPPSSGAAPERSGKARPGRRRRPRRSRAAAHGRRAAPRRTRQCRRGRGGCDRRPSRARREARSSRAAGDSTEAGPGGGAGTIRSQAAGRQKFAKPHNILNLC
jgi:hypothetical protein